MYQHILVPIDGTSISDLNVERAVELAVRLGARVTFVHASADVAASGDGALIHAVSPDSFADMAVGDTNVVLTKASAVARAAGVSYQLASRTSGHADEVIVELARQFACDLIVMASHGTKGLSGWLHRTTTERVLRRAAVAVLVTRVESTLPLTASERALGILREEHRSLAVVAHAMRRAAVAVAQLDSSELELLVGMIAYMRGFPQQEHHPKEELHLHHHLRARTTLAEPLLASLEEQHQREYALVGEVDQMLKQSLSAGRQVEGLSEAVETLARELLAHIGKEEREVFPLAQAHLSDADWTDIAAAFAANTDTPLEALSHEDFRALFRRIANLVAVPATGEGVLASGGETSASSKN
ncbi:MAG: universal stress protein UspA [Betaproteobacteria bacterium HGW-Betaproteobacteria-4]|jgi:nucleotide-binding universal stress UspA family protein/hemerythrin-like domain-containing protein|nr:MAG: universal stress protein UspA [Betaproteobacteria bacterium HGW-Betaproteobacteria-4]